MPTTELSPSDFENGSIGILDLLVKSKLAPSRGEAKRLVVQGGISADGNKISDPAAVFTEKDFEKDGRACLILKKGKKIYHKMTILHR